LAIATKQFVEKSAFSKQRKSVMRTIFSPKKSMKKLQLLKANPQ